MVKFSIKFIIIIIIIIIIFTIIVIIIIIVFFFYYCYYYYYYYYYYYKFSQNSRAFIARAHLRSLIYYDWENNVARSSICTAVKIKTET